MPAQAAVELRRIGFRNRTSRSRQRRGSGKLRRDAALRRRPSPNARQIRRLKLHALRNSSAEARTDRAPLKISSRCIERPD